jgi:two-component system sensor histidine kinase TctE
VSLYRDALDAADIAYDRSLLASTRALAERVSVRDGKVVADVPYVALDSFETDTLGRIYYRVGGLHGETVSGYDDLPPVPKERAPLRAVSGPGALLPRRLQRRAGAHRRPAAAGVRRFDARHRPDPGRRDAGRAPRAVAPHPAEHPVRQALLVLAVATLVWFAVRLVLQPLMRLKKVVETRALSDLSDVDEALVHREVRPLVAR